MRQHAYTPRYDRRSRWHRTRRGNWATRRQQRKDREVVKLVESINALSETINDFTQFITEWAA